MGKTLRGKLAYAKVVATLALFIAIGGASAFAATQLAKNGVGTKQLKKNAVTVAKIKDGAVPGAKTKLSSLGTVPSATRADTATSAGSASNASQLGGSPPSAYRDKCPTETALVAPGLCMTQGRGANDWNGTE